MTRLINLSSFPQWLRLLLGGLAASVLLHLLVLDAWRGQGSGRADPAGMSARLLAVRLTALPAPAAALAQPVVAQPVPAVRRPERAAERVAAAPARLSESSAQALASPAREISLRPEIAAESGILRPLTPAEGRVAYRLALLEAAGAGWPELSGSGVLLELALSPDGQAESVRLLRSSGDAGADQLWLARLQHAARRASVPDVLQGRAFALEMEFLP